MMSYTSPCVTMSMKPTDLSYRLGANCYSSSGVVSPPPPLSSRSRLRAASPQGRGCISDCFVTGEWKESENASTLLAMDDDGMDSDELDGDFEDMETGEKHQGTAGADAEAGSDQEEEQEEQMPVHKGERQGVWSKTLLNLLIWYTI